MARTWLKSEILIVEIRHVQQTVERYYLLSLFDIGYFFTEYKFFFFFLISNL